MNCGWEETVVRKRLRPWMLSKVEIINNRRVGKQELENEWCKDLPTGSTPDNDDDDDDDDSC